MTDSEYAGLLKAWNIEFAAAETDLEIGGSPERTAVRTVVRDAKGNRWILEQIETDNLDRKCEIAEMLARLSCRMNRVHPWLRTDKQLFFQTLENRNWMLRPYIEGMLLNRTTWLEDGWRIDAMSDFLLQLRKCSGLQSAPFFSIADYARDRMNVWSSRYPKLFRTLLPAFETLRRNFFPAHNSLPAAFCHGDFHPLNIVWGEREIRSVIDWEFCGIKPELYDVALLLGCIGFDDPDHLIAKQTVRLINRLRSARFGAVQSWENLCSLIASIRFGWMSEWIRRQDDEAVEMETVYIGILVDQEDYISNVWKTGTI